MFITPYSLLAVGRFLMVAVSSNLCYCVTRCPMATIQKHQHNGFSLQNRFRSSHL